MDWPSDSPHALLDPPRHRAEAPPSADQSVTLFDYWDVLVARRKVIAGFFLVGTALTLAISLLLPKIYESTSSVLPQLESKEGGMLSALLNSLLPAAWRKISVLGCPGFRPHRPMCLCRF